MNISNNIKEVLKRVLLISIPLAGGIGCGLFTSCTDDHFDINSEVMGRQTIWENIQSNPSLSEYADILRNVKYSTTEEKTTNETYADLFNGDQTFTVWAPLNGTFNYSYYKGLLESGKRDSIYKVEKELVRNSMTRFSHVINGKDSIKVDLFNSKSAWINYDKNTIKGQTIWQANIGASNGVLHLTEGSIAYQPNVYEYMATRADLSNINAFFKSFQKTKFDEGKSTQGPTINGQITWVDSITYISNQYNEHELNAFIEREDSNYVMILPTNDAWDVMYGKTLQYFNYKSYYKQDVNTQTEAGKDTVIEGAETKFTEEELDSLIKVQSKNAICQNLAFNANWQYERIPITSIKDIAAADSLKSTAGLKFKRPGTLNATNKNGVVEANFTEMFGGKDPVEVSNGYVYVVDAFKFPSTVFAPNSDISAERLIESSDNNTVPSTDTKEYIVQKVVDGEVVGDTTYKYNYFIMSPKSTTSHPGSFFKLTNVLSCMYDIYVVIGYNTNYNLQNKFRAYISYDNDSKRVANEPLKNYNTEDVDANGKTIYNTNYFVNKPLYREEGGEPCFTDTICIAHDFKFPICYKGLQNAYPTIQIKSNFQSGEKNIYTREIWVNAIILKAKEW